MGLGLGLETVDPKAADPPFPLLLLLDPPGQGDRIPRFRLTQRDRVFCLHSAPLLPGCGEALCRLVPHAQFGAQPPLEQGSLAGPPVPEPSQSPERGPPAPAVEVEIGLGPERFHLGRDTVLQGFELPFEALHHALEHLELPPARELLLQELGVALLEPRDVLPLAGVQCGVVFPERLQSAVVWPRLRLSLCLGHEADALGVAAEEDRDTAGTELSRGLALWRDLDVEQKNRVIPRKIARD